MALSTVQFIIAYAGQDMYSTPTLFFLALSFLFAFYGLSCHQFFVTIVKSQSMMPTLHRGDILFSTNGDVNIKVKDIVLAQVSKDVHICTVELVFKNRQNNNLLDFKNQITNW